MAIMTEGDGVRGDERVGNAGVRRTKREERDTEKDRAIGTYFLLLLLFSD